MFTILGKVEFTKGVLRAVLDKDFSDYYIKLFKSYEFNFNITKVSAPRYGPHVSIFIPAFHKTKKNLEVYIDKIVSISYSPEEIYEGGTKFMGYYLPIYSQDIEKIRDEIGVENNYQNRLHLCLFNNKAFI